MIFRDASGSVVATRMDCFDNDRTVIVTVYSPQTLDTATDICNDICKDERRVVEMNCGEEITMFYPVGYQVQ